MFCNVDSTSVDILRYEINCLNGVRGCCVDFGGYQHVLLILLLALLLLLLYVDVP